jgi:phosphopantothenate synthetase
MDFLQHTMDAALEAIKLLNAAQGRTEQAARVTSEMSGMDAALATEEWIAKSEKIGAELEVLWEVYYSCEKHLKELPTSSDYYFAINRNRHLTKANELMRAEFGYTA